MIAAENNLASRKLLVFGKLRYEVPETRGLHARVAAELVHLVRGGFDQNEGVIPPRMVHSRAEDIGIGGTDRADADRRSLKIGLDCPADIVRPGNRHLSHHFL